MGRSAVLTVIGVFLVLGAAAGYGLTVAERGPFAHYGDLSPGFLLFFFATPFGAGLLMIFASGPRSSRRRRVALEPVPVDPGQLKPRARRSETQHPPMEIVAMPPLVAMTERDRLLEKKDELETRINRAKVQYGLGQLSGLAYKNYLVGLEKERAELEERLLAIDLESRPIGSREAGTNGDGIPAGK